MDVGGPLTAKQARDLAGSIVRSESGEVRFSGHALKRMKERRVSEADIRNVLRFGTAFEDGCENGTWRYRMETRKFRIVIAFRSVQSLVIVTVVRLDVVWPGKTR